MLQIFFYVVRKTNIERKRVMCDLRTFFSCGMSSLGEEKRSDKSVASLAFKRLIPSCNFALPPVGVQRTWEQFPHKTTV